MLDDIVNIAVIGCGWWGPRLIRCFDQLPGSRVKSVADLDERRLELVKETYPHLLVTRDYRGILEDPEIEAVCVAVQMEYHYEVGRDVLEAGKHLLLEKPMTTSATEARELVALAEARERVLLVDHIYIYHPAVAFLKEMVASGRMGEILYVDATRYNLGPPHARYNVLWDLASHDISIVLHLFDESPVSVVARGWRFKRRNVEDVVSMRLDFASGRFARLHLSWLCAEKTRLMRIFCSSGTALYDDMADSGKIRLIGEGVDSRLSGKDSAPLDHTYGPSHVEIPALDEVEPLIREGEDFLDSIARGRKPLSSGEMGYEIVRVIEAASRSIFKGGMPVNI